MESELNHNNKKFFDISQTHKIFQGLCESSTSHFANLKEYPTTPIFIIELNNGCSVRLNTTTNEWCTILFVTSKDNILDNYNELPVRHLDDLVDKIVNFYDRVQYIDAQNKNDNGKLKISTTIY